MKIKNDKDIIKLLKNNKINVLEVLEITDNRVLHKLLKQGRVKFDYETREYYA
jgi:ABC-type Zn uptake system ZnuABC Zn-binding protein ZnuA